MSSDAPGPSFPRERDETLALVWPPHQTPPPACEVPGYEACFRERRADFVEVQRAAGWTVTDAQWEALLAERISDTTVFIMHGPEAVGVACAMRRPGDWTEPGWVAVSADHRGMRLGKMLCAALPRRLLATGRRRLYGSTQDDRKMALRIYLELGFHPVHRPEKVERWRRLCEELGRTFDPAAWGW